MSILQDIVKNTQSKFIQKKAALSLADLKLELSTCNLPKSSFKASLINKDEAMAIRIDVTSSLVTVDAMKKALIEGLEKSTGNNTGPIMKEIDQLTSTFNSDVSTGDFYEFIFLPDAGTNVLKNSVFIDTIPGIEFKKAFFGIWLSDNPIQKNLKKAMLGN